MDPAQEQPEVRHIFTLPCQVKEMPGGKEFISSPLPLAEIWLSPAVPSLQLEPLACTVPLSNINCIPACVRRGDQGPADSGDKELAGLKDSI